MSDKKYKLEVRDGNRIIYQEVDATCVETLRDRFAMAACTGAVANELFRREASHNPEVIAGFSYEVADAMLKARKP